MFCSRIYFILIGFMSILFIPSFGIFLPEKQDIEPCPLNPESVSHWITLPLTVSPNKQIYKVGDTVRFSFHESVMVRDLNMKRRFNMESFPFRPVHTMWRFEQDGDDIFFPIHGQNLIAEQRFRPEAGRDGRSAGYRMWAVIENDSFLAYSDIILETPGIYISSWYDVYTVTLEGAGGERSYAEPIEFEGQCQNHGLSIQNTLVGDSHLQDYIPELLRLDSLFNGNLTLDGAEQRTELSRGNFSANHRAFFAFEVVE